MKKYQQLIVFALVFAAVGLTANAQTRDQRGDPGRVPVSSTKPAPPASRLSDIQEILRKRQSGLLAPNDPCTTTVVSTVGAPIDASLDASDCLLTAYDTYIDFYDFQGTAGQAVYVSEVASGFDTYLYVFDSDGNVLDENDDSGATSDSRIPVDNGVVTLPYTGHYKIGASSYAARSTGAYTISVSTPAVCNPVVAYYNQNPDGTLASTGCSVNIDGFEFYTNLYTFYGVAGKQVSLTLSSTAFDAFLTLHSPTGATTLEDDDSGGGTNSRIPATGPYTLPETGIYTIEVSTFDPFKTGAYTLNITGPAGSTIGGRVVTPSGAGLRSAIVSLTDSFGVQRTATTSSFGFYSFTDVPPGPNYVVRILSRQYRFSPQTLQFNDDLTTVNFTGLE